MENKNDELIDLRVLVNQLKMITDNKDGRIVRQLQEINEVFLNEYHLEINGFIIEPLVIEAYYHKDIVFPDECVHAARNEKGKMVETARKRQKDNIGKLYIHDVKNRDDGLDVCLSNGDYYYSLLIKNALLNYEKFATQAQVSMELCGNCKYRSCCTDVNDCKYNETLVVKKNQKNKMSKKIIHIPRRNVPNDYKLASVSIEAIKADINNSTLTLSKGYAKQWKASIVALEESDNEEKAKELADRLNGSKVETEYFDEAKKCFHQ